MRRAPREYNRSMQTENGTLVDPALIERLGSHARKRLAIEAENELLAGARGFRLR